jgi:tol-pal system protein YbgF
MLLRKFFIYLCLSSVLNVSAEPIDENWQEVVQLRQQVEQLRDVLLDQEDKISQQQRELQKLRGDNEVLVHKIDQVQKQQQDIFLDMDKRLQAMATPAPPSDSPATLENAEVATSSPEVDTEKSVTSPQQPEVTPSAKTAKTTAMTPAETAKPTDSAVIKEVKEPVPTTSPKGILETARETIQKDKTLDTSAPVATMEAQNGTPNPPLVTELMESEELQYQKLIKLIDEGQEQQAVAGFEAFLQRYPQGKYSDNAQYWLGESYYATGNYAAAIKAFNTLLVTYPESPKYPHALLKIAFSHYELKEFGKARELLQQVRNNYIGTSASRLAERRLKKMTVEGY